MRVLIAMDESDHSFRAVEAFSRSMRHEDSHLLLLHVLEPPAVFEPDQSLWKREEQAKIFLKNASAQLQLADFRDIEIRVSDGEAPSKIVEIAQQWNADLIVLGSQGRTSVASILLGSVTEFVARHAGCSIVIVRRPDGPQTSGPEK
jgi:nucleotide-binding universal stress UspA family protein